VTAVEVLRVVLPLPVRRALISLRRRVQGVPAPGRVAFGDLRRLSPISRDFGSDRGPPLDRHYIEAFLERQRADVQGRVLEIGEDTYTRRFGGDRVTRADVLHVNDRNPRATFVGDLATADHIPSDAFDCIILTQTLQLIYELRPAILTLHRILKPGGVLLATVPGTTPVVGWSEWGPIWHWSFTELVMRRLLGEAFAADALTLETHGNVLAATALLHGLAADELTAEEIDLRDPDYPVIITARALKAARG
jgi:SAM-dependent methyltransferase